MEIPESLSRESTLTPKMLESLTSYLKVMSHETSLKEAAANRSTGAVSVGSYYRTVLQAREKIRGSVLTVVIAISLGVIRPEDLRRLFDAVGKGLPDLDEGERGRATAVIKALVDRIVMPK